MTVVSLIEVLKKLCEEAVKDMVLPVAVQKGDTEQTSRVPEIYRQRLPQSSAAKKLAPYVIVQAITSKQQQLPGQPKPTHTANIRFIGCVYSEDESEGEIAVLNLLERIKIHLLKQINIGGKFILDCNEPLEMLVYPDDTAPYFAGEMYGTFQLPPIQQEVNFNFEEKRNN